MPTVVEGMTRSVALLGVLLLATGCAAQVGSGAAPSGSPSPSTSAPSAGSEGDLVLQVAHTGGFVMPPTTFARLPLVSVYADGRVITEGPVIAIHPAPALPNLQVAQIDPGRVDDLVQQALDAGVGQDLDYGRPPIADVPSTRFTVVTDEGTEVTEVYALQEGLFPEPDAAGLTDEQVAARDALQHLLADLTAVGGPTESYEPESVAAVVTPYAEADDAAAQQPEVSWPGPPLPGEPLDERLGISCVTASGEAADAVLGAATRANQATPWTSDDGTRWSLLLRPLLPHETGCADLLPR